MNKIEWNETNQTPPIKSGSMNYFLVATKDGNPCFGAYYLNHYRLSYENGCPDLDEGGIECEDCINGNGHYVTGWFEETGSEDDAMFTALENEEFKVVAWTYPPIYSKVK